MISKILISMPLLLAAWWCCCAMAYYGAFYKLNEPEVAASNRRFWLVANVTAAFIAAACFLFAALFWLWGL